MEHEVTYTFSRALHLMWYGGKMMRSTRWKSSCYLVVENGELVRSCTGYDSNGNLTAEEIMGSWVEVKE